MANARDEAARRRYYIAYLNRGTARNGEILDQIVALRRELAHLYDLPSYAHYVTRRRMAGAAGRGARISRRTCDRSSRRWKRATSRSCAG